MHFKLKQILLVSLLYCSSAAELAKPSGPVRYVYYMHMVGMTFVFPPHNPLLFSVSYFLLPLPFLPFLPLPPSSPIPPTPSSSLLLPLSFLFFLFRPSPRLVRFRWVVPAGGETKLRLLFTSQDEGQFDQTLGFEIAGTRRRYQLFCRGLCVVPTICREPRWVCAAIFPHNVDLF